MPICLKVIKGVTLLAPELAEKNLLKPASQSASCLTVTSHLKWPRLSGVLSHLPHSVPLPTGGFYVSFLKAYRPQHSLKPPVEISVSFYGTVLLERAYVLGEWGAEARTRGSLQSKEKLLSSETGVGQGSRNGSLSSHFGQARDSPCG